MSPPRSIGPFALGELLGRGASGEVHHAVHSVHGTEVALKLLDPAKPVNDEAMAEFSAEVAVLAQTRHHGIVEIIDHGAERGRPWLALELCRGGNLLGLYRSMGWAEVRQLIIELLAALAHAHAAGVVHRDLKASNVMLAGPGDLRPGWKITDFGIAINQGTNDAGHPTGTPQYMAPEQWEEDSRDLGPWTDLYALGCLVTKVITGSTPFTSIRGYAVGHAHYHMPPPRLRPRFEIPEGVQAWVDELLAKNPRNRPQFAADALARFRELAPLETSSRPETTLVPGAEPDDTTVPSGVGLAVAGGPAWSRADTGLTVPPAAPTAHHESLTQPVLPIQLHGAGMSLFDHRTTPLTGRDDLARILWNRLTSVRTTGSLSVFALVGDPGVGLTRLAQWLAFRAHETGAAWPIWVEASQPQGLTDAFDRLLRCAGLDGDEAENRALLTLGLLGIDHQGVRHAARTWANGLEHEAHRHGAARVLCSGLARTRPVLLVLDQAAPWAVRLVHHLRAAERADLAAPVFVLLTSSQPENIQELDAAVHRRVVPHLPLPAMEALVVNTLPVERALAAELARRCEGRPAAAMAQLRALVRSGRLTTTERGFALPAAGLPPLPLSLAEEWFVRIDTELTSWPKSRVVWLTRAAIAGGLTRADRAHFPDGWSEPGWTISGAGRVRFRDPIAAEALTQAAGESAALHHAWWLARLPDDAPADRVARHLFGSGRMLDGLQHWSKHLGAWRDRVSVGSALAIAESCMRIARQIRAPRRLQAHFAVHALRCHTIMSSSAEVKSRAEGLLATAEEEDWQEIVAEACLALGGLHRAKDWAEMRGWYIRTLAAEPDETSRIKALQGLALAQRALEIPDWDAPLKEASDRVRNQPDQRTTWLELESERLQLRGDRAGCRPLLRELVERLQAEGQAVPLLRAKVRLGDLADTPTEAERQFAEVAREAALLGEWGNLMLATINRALALARLGRWREARTVLRGPPEPNLPLFFWIVVVVRLRIAAEGSDWEEVATQMSVLANDPERVADDIDGIRAVRESAERIRPHDPKAAKRLDTWVRTGLTSRERRGLVVEK